MSYEVLQALKSLVISAQVSLSHAATQGPLNTQFFEDESDPITTSEPEGENQDLSGRLGRSSLA
jgi:hypothetical protein